MMGIQITPLTIEVAHFLKKFHMFVLVYFEGCILVYINIYTIQG